jgi:hypothetical protein
MTKLTSKQLAELIALTPSKFKGYLTLFGDRINYEDSPNISGNGVLELPIPDDRIIELKLLQELAEHIRQMLNKEHLLVLLKGVN